MSKTTGLAWTMAMVERHGIDSIRLGDCSYCRHPLEPGRDNCRTCGAPV